MYSCLMCVCTAMMLRLKDFVGCTLRRGDASFQRWTEQDCTVNVMDVLALLQVWKAKQFLRIFFYFVFFLMYMFSRR